MSLRNKQTIGRRTRDSSWQWMMIGIFLGMGCSLVMVLSANLFGVIEFAGIDGGATEEVVVLPTTEVPLPTSPPNNTGQNPTIAPTENIAQPPTFTVDPNAGVGATLTPTPLPGGSAGPTTDPKFDSGTTNNTNTGGGTPVVGTQAVPTITQVGPPTSTVPTGLLSVASPLVPVEGGTFTMGTTVEEGRTAVSECVQRDGGTCSEVMVVDSTVPHQVTLNAFQIEQYEVSVAQYVTFLNSLVDQGASSTPHLSACVGNPCIKTTSEDDRSDIDFDGTRYSVRLAGTELDRSNYPMTLVTWYGAQAYCQALGRTLPSEAQWERAARGPQNLVYPWGQNWIADNANTSRSGLDGIMLVTEYPTGASGWGALNMAGNVAEWTQDDYNANYYASSPSANPVAVGGDKKVVRGGSWDNVPLFARTVHRMDTWGALDVASSVGFRCIQE